MTDRSALPAHYASDDEGRERLRPTPGIEASELADEGVADDERRINEHWRRRTRRRPPPGDK